MARQPDPITILCAEDDPDDRLLMTDALAASRLGNDLRFVEDGVELMDYLHRRGRWADPADSPAPGIILLDLNMPRMDGREALSAIKTEPRLRHIPIVVLTTSSEETDIARSYGIGANSYIIKPVTFDSLVDVVRELNRYWFEIVSLPTPQDGVR
jgi:CheY-like chemotaxis protein